MKKSEIENTFRNSNDSNELFDTFHFAIENNVGEIDLFKILLGNPTLSQNEIAMYTDKLAIVLPNSRYELFIWTGDLFGTKTLKIEAVERALYYFKQAANLKPEMHEPYECAMNLYNYDINFSTNKAIIKFLQEGISSVKKRSKLYELLANHYKNISDEVNHKKYRDLFEKSKRTESD